MNKPGTALPREISERELKRIPPSPGTPTEASWEEAEDRSAARQEREQRRAAVSFWEHLEGVYAERLAHAKEQQQWWSK